MKVHLVTKHGKVLCGDGFALQHVVVEFPGAYPYVAGTDLYTRKRRKATCKKCLYVHGKMISEKNVKL